MPAVSIKIAMASIKNPKKLEKNGFKNPGLTIEKIAIKAKGIIITIRDESLA